MTTAEMLVRYETWYAGEDRPPVKFVQAVRQAAEESSTRRVCEIGGGANPILPLSVTEHADIVDYVVTDISEEELEKAPAGYTKIVADATRVGSGDHRDFDLVVSHTVAEHVTDPSEFHRAVFDMLAPGGRAMHFFPTLYDPAFILNRLFPESLSDAILQRIQPNRVPGGKHQKFPAYYRWCRGPTQQQLARLTGIGFEIQEYVGVFGHGYYQRMPAVDRLGTRLADLLAEHPRPSLTAYAWVTLRRPKTI